MQGNGKFERVNQILDVLDWFSQKMEKYTNLLLSAGIQLNVLGDSHTTSLKDKDVIEEGKDILIIKRNRQTPSLIMQAIDAGLTVRSRNRGEITLRSSYHRILSSSPTIGDYSNAISLKSLQNMLLSIEVHVSAGKVKGGREIRKMSVDLSDKLNEGLPDVTGLIYKCSLTL